MLIARVIWDVFAVFAIADLYLIAERIRDRHRRKQWINEQVALQVSRHFERPGQHHAARHSG